jgi:small GTP-binding protein
MASSIAALLRALFPPTEFRGLLIGLDAVGKTSILYKLKLGEVVTTIPTIGFNVETITYGSTNMTMWDVGGCDKIRPLWRHYYQNTQAVIYVVDSVDVDRFRHTNDAYDKYSTSEGLFHATLSEDELKGCKLLVFLNKQDLAGTMTRIVTVQDIEEAFQLKTRYRHIQSHIQPCCATSGDGLYEGLGWLVEALHGKATDISGAETSEAVADPLPSSSTTSTAESATEKPSVLEEWLTRVDDDDDSFLQRLEDLTLDNWDHYTHLRIAYVLLKRLGRSQAMPRIFHLIKTFIERSPHLNHPSQLTGGSNSAPPRRSTFHETMTYFWVHMVHYALASTPPPMVDDFHSFLLLNPQLSNSGLFLTYYSKKLMLQTPEARSQVLLADVRPLPSLLPSNSTVKSNNSAIPSASNTAPLTDREFFQRCLNRQLSSWGHLSKLRLIYTLLIAVAGRRKGGTDRILEVLASVEGPSNSHISANYFWIHMVSTCALAVVHGGFNPAIYGRLLQPGNSTGTVEEECWDEALESFEQFIQRKPCQRLNDSDLLYQ